MNSSSIIGIQFGMMSPDQIKKSSVAHITSKDTYIKLDLLRKEIVPNTTISRAQTVNILVNEKVKLLNGKLSRKK